MKILNIVDWKGANKLKKQKQNKNIPAGLGDRPIGDEGNKMGKIARQRQDGIEAGNDSPRA